MNICKKIDIRLKRILQSKILSFRQFGQMKSSKILGRILQVSLLSLLVFGIPVVFAQQNLDQCLQEKECLLLVQQLNKAFRDNLMDIYNLELLSAKLHSVYEKKESTYSATKKAAVEKEFTALENAILESKDWHQAFLEDMNEAISDYDTDEIVDLFFSIGDIKEPVEKAYTLAKKIRKLLL